MSDLDFDPLLKRVHRVLQMLPKASEALEALRNLEALEHSHLGCDLDRRFAQRRIFGARDLFDVATLLGPVRRALDAEWHQVVIDEEGMVRPVVERQRRTAALCPGG
ncbi:hypothetical protein [Mameliella sp.]|uniref:hypothetical protein n=1 Tax=Mameliella sp. TaxID=1924940 RepID=UPI003B509645